MCGIVGAVAQRDITPILVEGLKRLEYRGYDSCGVAVYADGHLRRTRSTQRVAELSDQIAQDHVTGFTGIAHTRWATHGVPATHNAHPHFSHLGNDEPRIALVHNGIIENTTNCAPSCRPPATSSKARPTPRSSPTWSTTCTPATCSRPCSRPCAACMAPMPSPCSAAMNRTAWSAPARARRWWWAWARTRTSWRPMRWPWPAPPTRSSTWKTATSSTCS